MVCKNICYKEAKTLGDMEEATRLWQQNLTIVRKWIEVLRHRMIWHGCIDKQLSLW
jgi:hypothetical protein